MDRPKVRYEPGLQRPGRRCPAYKGGINMHTVLALGDEGVVKAHALTGPTEKSSQARDAFQALIQRKSARRLARLGGSEPTLEAASRR